MRFYGIVEILKKCFLPAAAEAIAVLRYLLSFIPPSSCAHRTSRGLLVEKLGVDPVKGRVVSSLACRTFTADEAAAMLVDPARWMWV
jgi:hypothetical protein